MSFEALAAAPAVAAVAWLRRRGSRSHCGDGDRGGDGDDAGRPPLDPPPPSATAPCRAAAGAAASRPSLDALLAEAASDPPSRDLAAVRVALGLPTQQQEASGDVASSKQQQRQQLSSSPAAASCARGLVAAAAADRAVASALDAFFDLFLEKGDEKGETPPCSSSSSSSSPLPSAPPPPAAALVAAAAQRLLSALDAADAAPPVTCSAVAALVGPLVLRASLIYFISLIYQKVFETKTGERRARHPACFFSLFLGRPVLL